MRLITYSLGNKIRLGVLLDKKVIDVKLACLEYCRIFQKPAGFEDQFDSLQGWLKADEEVRQAAGEAVGFITASPVRGKFTSGDLYLDLDDVSLLAPLSNPGKVICVAGNFPAPGKLSAPEYPIIFLKPTSSITGPGMPIWITELTTSVGYEVEMAVVMAKRAHRVGILDAFRCIGGYSLANDVGDRMLEKRTSQWTSGKMFDSFTPLGPALVTPDEIPDIHAQKMETWVNGRQVQKAVIGEMFFTPDYLVSYISHLTTLEPGDVILTGSPKLMDGEPAPVVSLKSGDTVRIAIDGLGELSNPVREEPK